MEEERKRKEGKGKGREERKRESTRKEEWKERGGGGKARKKRRRGKEEEERRKGKQEKQRKEEERQEERVSNYVKCLRRGVANAKQEQHMTWDLQGSFEIHHYYSHTLGSGMHPAPDCLWHIRTIMSGGTPNELNMPVASSAKIASSLSIPVPLGKCSRLK